MKKDSGNVACCFLAYSELRVWLRPPYSAYTRGRWIPGASFRFLVKRNKLIIRAVVDMWYRMLSHHMLKDKSAKHGGGKTKFPSTESKFIRPTPG